MPSRNVVKTYVTDSYYHVYNRGVAKQAIFRDETDKHYFIKLLARYLDPENEDISQDGTRYRKFNDDVELFCYCLMKNHFHLLFFTVRDALLLPKLLQSVCTAYTMYFNKKYKRVGTLFQGVFKASRIDQDSYLQHISRYIHLNPRRHTTYRYSSYAYYTGTTPPRWLNPERILGLFEYDDYAEFVNDYEEHARMLDELKHELANDL